MNNSEKDLYKGKYRQVTTQPQKINVSGNANMERLQPTKQNDMVAINNNYKVSKNDHTTNEDKNKQIHSQIKNIKKAIFSIKTSNE